MIDRRRVIGLAAVGASALALPTLYSCTKKSASHLSMLGEDSSNLHAIAGELAGFKRDTGIEVNSEAADFATALSKATTDLSQGTGAYDIVLQYNFSLSPFVRNNYIYSIGDLKRLAGNNASFQFEADLLPNVWRELGYFITPPFADFESSQPVAYPFAANTMVMVYNKKVLNDPTVVGAYQRAFGRAFTPPATWEDYARAIKLVRQANPQYYGVALQGANEGWLYYEWMNFLFGMGGRMMNKTYGWQSDLSTPLTVDSPEAQRAAALYLSLREANAGDFFSIDAVKQRDILLEGKTAFGIVWTDYVPDLVRQGGGDFGFAPVPGDKSMIAGGSYFVSRASHEPSIAVQLISYLSSPVVQKRMALNGLFPPTKAALSAPEVLAKPYMPAVKASVERGVYMCEAGPDSDLISQEVTNAMQRAWRGEIGANKVGGAITAAVTTGRRSLR